MERSKWKVTFFRIEYFTRLQRGNQTMKPPRILADGALMLCLLSSCSNQTTQSPSSPPSPSKGDSIHVCYSFGRDFTNHTIYRASDWTVTTSVDGLKIISGEVNLEFIPLQAGTHTGIIIDIDNGSLYDEINWDSVRVTEATSHSQAGTFWGGRGRFQRDTVFGSYYVTY